MVVVLAVVTVSVFPLRVIVTSVPLAVVPKVTVSVPSLLKMVPLDETKTVTLIKFVLGNHT